MQIPTLIKEIAVALDSKGARAVAVGGAVRDWLLGRPLKDLDIEVYGLPTLEALTRLLKAFGRVDAVGKSFGVIKLTRDGVTYDFSFPRKERAIGKRHRDFEVHIDGTLDFAEAARRRDFTINAMGYDIVHQKLYDPYGGREDIFRRRLRHIDETTFVEDPLRVYRAVQFAARLGFRIDRDTVGLCRKMTATGMLAHLPVERIWAEWRKIFEAPYPSVGFEWMRRIGILDRHFPELAVLSNIPQSPVHHPEGNVWRHTLWTLDAMRDISADLSEKERLVLMMAALCHDLGKADTTIGSKRAVRLPRPIRNQAAFACAAQLPRFDAGKRRARLSHGIVKVSTAYGICAESRLPIRAIGHEILSETLSEALLAKLTGEKDLKRRVLSLVRHHLKPFQFVRDGAKNGAYGRLALKVDVAMLAKLAEADALGRTTRASLKGVCKVCDDFKRRIETLELHSGAPKPLVTGKDLIAAGLQPSPRFKAILRQLYALQVEGKFEEKETAIAYLKKELL